MITRIALCVAAGLLLSACGGSSSAARHSPSVSPTPAASPSAGGSASPGAPFPSPSPDTTSVASLTASCTAPPAAGEQLALVALQGGTGIVVRDITDIAHPTTRCTIARGGSTYRFVSATEITYVAFASGDLGAAGAMYMFNTVIGTTSLVRSWSYSGPAADVYAWSPDGSRLSYLSSDTTGLKWHLLSASGDRVLATLGTIPARDVSPDNDDAMVGFSSDGQYVAVEQTYTGGTNPVRIQVDRASDGSIVYTRHDGTMAAWAGAGARLYFRTTAGVQSWDPTHGVVSISPNLVWIHPQASPDGSRMAFSVLNAQTNHIGEVLDLTTGATHSLSLEPRVGAAFLNASLVWYAGETICTTVTPCGLGGPALSGQTYIYDLGSDVETQSLDTDYYDAWPHSVGES
jgi:hypothetical protein